MADEDLTASHWDDVYSDSPFTSRLPNILQSDEFAPPSFDDDDSPNQSRHEEHNDDEQHQNEDEDVEDNHNNTHLSHLDAHSGLYDYNSSPINPEVNTAGTNITSANSHYQTPENYNNNDNASTEATKSINNESKVKNQTLLSSLTKDIDDAPLNTSAFATVSKEPQHVNKNESLFNASDSQDSKFNLFSANSNDININEPKTVKKYSSAPIKMFKAPRVRRNKQHAATATNSANDSTETTAAATTAATTTLLSSRQANHADSSTSGAGIDSNPLGPLGESLKKNLTISENNNNADEDNDSKKPTPAEKLVQSADAPLYNIQKPISANHKKLTDNPALSAQIGEYFQKKEQDKYQKNLPKKPEPEGEVEPLEVNVGDPTKVGDLTSAHIVYTVRAASSTKLLNSDEVVVTRRYKDFRWLYHQLQANNQGFIIPPPPSKQAVGRFNEQFIESRRFALEKMLQKIASNAILQKDPDFLMFLQSSNFSAESKEREKITGSGASNATDDYESAGGSAGSGSSGGGFMSALGGAFSFSTKVTDNDEYFLDQKAYVEDLDMQLKAFYKNFELIVQQRNELSNVTDEFANALLALAEIETSKSSNVLLSSFAQTQHRIKELLERQSLQDLITLGSVLDEYIRILGSIRAIFSQRHKALAATTNADYELNKKQASLEKTIRNHRNQVDKIEAMKREVAAYEQKNLNLKVKYDNVSNTIKKELNKFEFEKIDDFRNSVETFLESLIESQKEAIELWETFYDRQKLDEVEEVSFDEAK